jgi:hypothetical protein
MPRKKTTKKAKATKKSSKMDAMSQTHGQVEKTRASTLEQIWGDEGLGKYKTKDKEEYHSQLKEMNTTDLQKHATTVGLIPVQNREILAKRLLKEFDKHWNSYKRPTDSAPPIKANKKIKDILSEGR